MNTSKQIFYNQKTQGIRGQNNLQNKRLRLTQQHAV